MYIPTLNFPNQVSIIWFYLGFLKTWLHRNKDISIDDFIIDIIVRAASTFINLEYHSFIEINYSKIIHYCFFFNRARNKNILICYGWASTEQCTSYSINLAQNGHPFCEVALHSTSLHRERVHREGTPLLMT